MSSYLDMESTPSRLSRQLQQLLAQDLNFHSFWGTLDVGARREFIASALVIESVCPDERLLGRFAQANRAARRQMVTVREQDFQLSRVPKDWSDFVRNESLRRDLCDKARSDLTRWLESMRWCRPVRMYGDIKSLPELRPEDLKRGDFAEATWDAVRYRIVVADLLDAERLAIAVWRDWLESILRCRNYYYLSKWRSDEHTYRAVHFQLQDKDGYHFELQIMTLSSEVISHLEHPVFKGRIELEAEQSAWLRLMCMKALVHDIELVGQRESRT